jgi:hypothetical protein
MTLPVILSFVGAVVVAVSAYLVAVRRSSGDVRHTDADELLGEFKLLRQEWKDEALDGRETIKGLRVEVATLTSHVALLTSELNGLRIDIQKANGG